MKNYGAKFTGEKGEIIKLGQYNYEHALSINDILPQSSDYSYLKLSSGRCVCRRYKTRSKWNLAKQIYHSFFSLMIRELIYEGHIYLMPVQQGARVFVCEKPQKEIIVKRKRGKYMNVDLLESDFKIYEVVIEYVRYGELKRRYVKIPHYLYQEMVELVHKGKRYQQGQSTTGPLDM